MPIAPSDLVEVGYVMDAQGIQGHIKVRPHSPEPQALIDSETIWLKPTGLSKLPAKELLSFEVSDARYHSGNVVMKLEGLKDRNQAESLRGCLVFMSRADFPELDDDDTFYWTDLIGSVVKNLEGEELGVVEQMMDNGAQSVLVVQNSAKKQQLIPFVEAIVREVNLEDEPGLIVVDWQMDW